MTSKTGKNHPIFNRGRPPEVAYIKQHKQQPNQLKKQPTKPSSGDSYMKNHLKTHHNNHKGGVNHPTNRGPTEGAKGRSSDIPSPTEGPCARAKGAPVRPRPREKVPAELLRLWQSGLSKVPGTNPHGARERAYPRRRLLKGSPNPGFRGPAGLRLRSCQSPPPSTEPKPSQGLKAETPDEVRMLPVSCESLVLTEPTTASDMEETPVQLRLRPDLCGNHDYGSRYTLHMQESNGNAHKTNLNQDQLTIHPSSTFQRRRRRPRRTSRNLKTITTSTREGQQKELNKSHG